MQCPHCVNVPLAMSDRQGVEIDYCPQCRGVWLDRGELDKLLERSASASADANLPRYDHYRAPKVYPHKRRKSWLEEIFD